MQVRALKTVPNFARRGAVRSCPRNVGRVLILLGQVERVQPAPIPAAVREPIEEPAPADVELQGDTPKRPPSRRAPRKTTTDKPAPARKPRKGTYRRRDLTAEPA